MQHPPVSRPDHSAPWKREVRSGLRVSGLILLWILSLFLLVGAAVDLGLLRTNSVDLFPGGAISGVVELVLGLAILVLIADQWMKAITALSLFAVLKALVSALNGEIFPSGAPIQPSVALAWAVYCLLIAGLSWRFMFSKPTKADKGAGIILLLSLFWGAQPGKLAYLAPGLVAMFATWLWSKHKERARRTAE